MLFVLFKLKNFSHTKFLSMPMITIHINDKDNSWQKHNIYIFDVNYIVSIWIDA